EIIAPPKKAAVVFEEEGEGGIPQAQPVEGIPLPPSEGIFNPSDVQPLRALPVEPLDGGLDPQPTDGGEAVSPLHVIPEGAPRATPVDEQEDAEADPGPEPPRALPIGP
ncbi:MAG: hypothetical protein R3242_01940, partial [Akkermansiaceae bacterium]|nr:hypothetical protein [Akkermansiaceae bacterium]